MNVQTGTVVLTPPPAREAFRARAPHGGGSVGMEERQVLRRTLSPVLRAVRAEAGMTQQMLALRSGASPHSVQAIEEARRRPSLAMLHALAAGLCRRIPPVSGLDSEQVLALLVTTAGRSLVADTPGGVRRRHRRLRDAGHVYRRAVEAWWAGEMAAAQRAELDFVAAIDILDLPGALDDGVLLAQAIRRLEAHSAWLVSGRRGSWGTTSAFRKMAARHGYPVSRRRAS